MVSQLSDQNARFHNLVHHSMFCIDATGPIATQNVSQRFRLAYSAVWIPNDIFDELIDPDDHPWVRHGLPERVIFPRLRCEDEVHARSLILRATPLPDSSA